MPLLLQMTGSLTDAIALESSIFVLDQNFDLFNQGRYFSLQLWYESYDMVVYGMKLLIISGIMLLKISIRYRA